MSCISCLLSCTVYSVMCIAIHRCIVPAVIISIYCRISVSVILILTNKIDTYITQYLLWNMLNISTKVILDKMVDVVLDRGGWRTIVCYELYVVFI